MDVGNFLCLVAIEVSRMCIQLGIGFTIENPLTSMMWSFPPMVAFLEEFDLHIVVLNYCRF